MGKERSPFEPVWLSVKIAAALTSMSEDWIDKEFLKKKRIPVFKDQDSDGQRGTLRFRAADFWAEWNRRFGVPPDDQAKPA